MKTPFLPVLICSCLLWLVACQSKPPVVKPANLQGAARDTPREAPTENYDTLSSATRSHFPDVQAFLDFIKRPGSNTNVTGDEWNSKFQIGNIDS